MKTFKRERAPRKRKARGWGQATGFDRLDWLRMRQSLWPDETFEGHWVA
jgi:hypothetical protein